MYWIVECQNFLAESLSILISFGIIVYYQQLEYNYSINYFLPIMIICFYKYSHNINDRKLYLALKNFQEWERLSEKIIPNLFILQSFDYRTHKMKVYDCNQRAKKYQINSSSEKYIEFLSLLKIEEFLTISKPFDSFFSNQGVRTLKDYLLKRHEEIYRFYIENEANTQKKYQDMKIKNIRQSPNNQGKQKEGDRSQDFVENLSVSMTNQETQKKVCFKVKIFPLNMNEPFLIICMEDISLFQKIQHLKEKQINQVDLVQELVKCLEKKMQAFQSAKQSSIRNFQRKIMEFKLILQSFLQKLNPLNIQQFQFSEIIDKIKLIFNDQNINILGEYQDLNLLSDKKYVFKSIFTILSSFGLENISQIEISQFKDKLTEKVSLNISVKSSDQINEQEKTFNLFDLVNYQKLNSMCFKQLQNIMKCVCLQDKPEIYFQKDNSILIKLEYLTDVNLLKQSLTNNQDKLIFSPQMLKKPTCASILNITKSNIQQSLHKNSFKSPSKQSSIKLIQTIKELEHDQVTEDQIRLDSIQSSQICVKFTSKDKEIDLTKIDKPIANFVYNFQKITQNQRKDIS